MGVCGGTSSTHGELRTVMIEPDVQKIAVLRANVLGDFIFTIPALAALRATYPRAEIVLLGREWHADFLAGRPGPVDRVVLVPHAWPIEYERGLQEDPPEMVALFAALGAERFDIAVQLYGGGGYSNPFVQRLDARLTIGLRAPEAPALDRWVPYIFYQPEVLRYLEVVALVGARTDVFEPRIAVTDGDLAESYRVVPETRRPLVALHPGATDSRRRWPVEKFAAVGDALAAAGAQVVVTGSSWEAEIVAGVVAAMRAEARDLCGQLSLNGLTGLLARCRVVVANDTGPLHQRRRWARPRSASTGAAT